MSPQNARPPLRQNTVVACLPQIIHLIPNASSLFAIHLGHPLHRSVRWLHHCSVPVSSALDPLAVHAWGARVVRNARLRLFSAVVVDVFEVKGMEMSREVPVPRGKCVRTPKGFTRRPGARTQEV